MSSDIRNSEQNLCGANSVNNQLIFNGTNGNLNNNNRINTNRVRVSLEFDHNEASSSGCVPSSEWYKYYRIARKNKKKKAAHIKFRLRCFDNLNEIRDSVNNMEYLPERSQAFVITVPKSVKSSPPRSATASFRPISFRGFSQRWNPTCIPIPMLAAKVKADFVPSNIFMRQSLRPPTATSVTLGFINLISGDSS